MRNDKKNSFLCNVGLLSLSYFMNRISREEDFKSHTNDEIKKIWLDLRATFLEHESLLNHKSINESDTEKYLIDPVLKRLRYHTLTKSAVKAGKRKAASRFPDYALFNSTKEIESGLNAEHEYKFVKALAIVEAKKFGLTLNDIDDHDEDERLPAVQLVDYLQKTNVSWGFLTNGKQWQLYHGRGQYAVSKFFEVELTDLLSHPVCTHEFAIFVHIFEKAAVLKDKTGKCRLDRILENSKNYAQEIGVPFFAGCDIALRSIFAFYQNSLGALKDEFQSRQCHQASLVLLFRLIAIRYLEDRGVLPTLDNKYRDLSLDKMRMQIDRTIRGGDKFSDKDINLWQKVRLLFKDINTGVFGIYPGHKGFESNLFELDFDTFFRDHPMPDSVMADIVDKICRGAGKDLGQIDFYDMGVEKIGDVYNQLLALRIVEDEKHCWHLTYSDYLKKELGSYFTHPRLTHLLSESVGEYLSQHYPNNADWLKLKICDNSCGSGHFLRQMIEDISYQLYISKENTSKKETDRVVDQNSFRRMLAQHCIFGIDKDINAVWLTKLSLWLHTAEMGKPFVFLDHHIVQGDSILSTVEIPKLPNEDYDRIQEIIVQLNKQHSDTKAAVRQSDQLYAKLKAVTKKHVRLRNPQMSLFGTSKEIKETYFSYALSFPEVFLNKTESLRGFSIIVGNPPWETVKPKLPDFYKKETGAEKAPKRKIVDQWLASDKSRKARYDTWCEGIKKYSKAIKESGYLYQSGEVYTYSYFSERSMQTLRLNGLLCYVVKLGLYGDDKVKGFRKHLFIDNFLEKMWIVKTNRIGKEKFFAQVAPNEKFTVFVARKGGLRQQNLKPQYEMQAKQILSWDDVNHDFKGWQRYFVGNHIDADFKVTVYDSEIRKNISEKLLKRPTVRSSRLKVGAELHLTNDRKYFTSTETEIPILTGYELAAFRTKEPENWCKDTKVAAATKTFGWDRLGVNDIIPDSRRKVRCAIIPKDCLTANSVLLVYGFESPDAIYLAMAGINSMLTDYYLRPNLSNMHLNNFRLYNLPIPVGIFDLAKTEIVAEVKKLCRKKKYEENDEAYKKVEAVIAASYELTDGEIRSYLSAFDKTEESFIQDVIDYAQIYRKKFKIRVAS